MDDHERGYQDGLEAGREANQHAKADNVVGELVGDMLKGVEEIIAESCTLNESDEYREGFREGVEATY